MMHGLMHRMVDHPFRFKQLFWDIQQLNEHASKCSYDITKISAAHFPQVSDRYDLLDAGAAMGFGVGPILVATKAYDLSKIHELTIAIPGEHTTAHKLFSHFYQAGHKLFMNFADIEASILMGKVDAGVLIHEGRFTYQTKGLTLLVDLGTKWEQTYSLPIPLGVFVCKKDIPPSIKQKINQCIRHSIQFAFDHPSLSKAYIKQHAQELDDEVISKHIQLYVNEYSLDMGSPGKKALQFLLNHL